MSFHEPHTRPNSSPAPAQVTNPGGGPVGFGCGLLLGAFIGVLWWAQADGNVGWAIAAALVFGVLGYWRGDRFWHWVLPRLHWFS